MDKKALLGLLSGVGLVVATLIAVAALNAPAAEGAATTTESLQSQCAPGYGVQPRHSCATPK